MEPIPIQLAPVSIGVGPRKSSQSSPRLITLETTTTAVPPNTVKFHFTVDSDRDTEVTEQDSDHTHHGTKRDAKPSGMGVMALDQPISIPHFTYTFNRESNGKVTSQSTTITADFISENILYRNGCTIHSYSPHAHLVPIGPIRISEMIVGDPVEFAMAMDNIEYYEDFEASFLDWMQDLKMVRCYRLEQDLVALEMEEELRANSSNSKRKGSGRTLLERMLLENPHRIQNGDDYHIRDVFEGMNTGAQPEEGGLVMDMPHSYTLDHINELRKDEGEPSIQTVMNNNSPAFEHFQHARPWKAHVNSDTTPAVMTEFANRRLITEVDGEYRAEVERQGPSYLHSVNSTMAVAIAYLPYLPWWFSVCAVLLTVFCIWCGIKMAMKLAEMKRMKASYQPIRGSLAAPRNSNMQSRYLDFPMPDLSAVIGPAESAYEEEEEEEEEE